MTSLEPEIEEFLLRIVPGLAREWEGAAPAEIDAIERIAGRPLPRLYRWFLARMGKTMGPMSFVNVDFSARAVLGAYASGVVTPIPGFLLIGLDSNIAMRLHYFYNLDIPARGDALVTRMDPLEGPDGACDVTETFRELLAWTSLVNDRIDKSPQQCDGWFSVDNADVCSSLDPIMSMLGFTRPIPTGLYCGLYEHEDAALMCRAEPGDDIALMHFYLGGKSAGALRRLLGAIATASVTVKINEWKPRLP